MSSIARPLALAFPLRGSQLIEASAGTGKTFTISALYLRLILGHGADANGFGRELLPPQILVVFSRRDSRAGCTHRPVA
jgi:exodeoxyribonuclease V beta subunit